MFAMCMNMQVRSFGTPDEVDAWLYNDPLRCPVALHFVEKTGSVMGYGIQTNYTTTSIRGKSENPTLQFQIPLQIAAESELARSVLAGIPYQLHVFDNQV